MFRLDPRRLQLEKFHSRKPIESLSDIKRERERRGELSRMHRYPLPLLSFSPPQSLDNRRCVRVLSPELTPQGISRFLCVDCWTSNKDEAGGYPLASHRYTGLPTLLRLKRPTPLIRERPGTHSRESPFAKWFSSIDASYVINPRKPIVIPHISRYSSNRLPAFCHRFSTRVACPCRFFQPRFFFHRPVRSINPGWWWNSFPFGLDSKRDEWVSFF